MKKIFLSLLFSNFLVGIEVERGLKLLILKKARSLTPCDWGIYRSKLAGIGKRLTVLSQVNKRCHVLCNSEPECQKIIRIISTLTGTTDTQVLEQFLQHAQCKKIYDKIQEAFKPETFLLDTWYLNATKKCEPEILDDMHRAYDGGNLPPLSVAIKTLDKQWAAKLIAQGANVNFLYLSNKDIITPLYEAVSICIEAHQEEKAEDDLAVKEAHGKDKYDAYYIIELLLKNGARVDVVSVLNDGLSDTAWQKVVSAQEERCVQLLWTYGKYKSDADRERCCLKNLMPTERQWFNSLGLQ